VSSFVRKNGRTAEGGFTLLEIVVALALVATAATGLAAAVSAATKANAMLRERGIALTAAQAKMEEMLATWHTGKGASKFISNANRSFAVPGLTPQDGQLAAGTIVGGTKNEAPLYTLIVRVAWKGSLGNDSVSVELTVYDP
jgi:type II secretion system protein I